MIPEVTPKFHLNKK